MAPLSMERWQSGNAPALKAGDASATGVRSLDVPPNGKYPNGEEPRWKRGTPKGAVGSIPMLSAKGSVTAHQIKTDHRRVKCPLEF